MSVDREKLLKRLAITLNQIAETADDIAWHQAAIAALNGNGQGANLAQKMLAYAEHMHQRRRTAAAGRSSWPTRLNHADK
jgi:hypothetical protein